jgi:hypothetical protein
MKKKALIITLCSVGLVAVTAAVVLPLTMCRNSSITFKNNLECADYLEKHAVATPDDAPNFGNDNHNYAENRYD